MIYLGTYSDSQINFRDFDFIVRDEARGRGVIRRTWAATEGDFLELKNVQGGGATLDDNITISQSLGILFGVDGAERMRIGPNGNVGINGSAGSTETLRVTSGSSTGSHAAIVGLGGGTTCSWPTGSNGVLGCGNTNDFYAGGAGTNYGAASSVRWKKNISEIKNAVEMSKGMSGVYFDWDEEHGGRRDIGFIAEEIAKYVPEIVIPDETDANYSIGLDYSKMTPVLLQAIKEQQEQIEQLKKENEQIRARLLVLEERMNKTGV